MRVSHPFNRAPFNCVHLHIIDITYCPCVITPLQLSLLSHSKAHEPQLICHLHRHSCRKKSEEFLDNAMKELITAVVAIIDVG